MLFWFVANLVLEISEITASCKNMSKNVGVVSILSFDVKVSVKEINDVGQILNMFWRFAAQPEIKQILGKD